MYDDPSRSPAKIERFPLPGDHLATNLRIIFGAILLAGFTLPCVWCGIGGLYVQNTDMFFRAESGFGLTMDETTSEYTAWGALSHYSRGEPFSLEITVDQEEIAFDECRVESLQLTDDTGAAVDFPLTPFAASRISSRVSSGGRTIPSVSIILSKILPEGSATNTLKVEAAIVLLNQNRVVDKRTLKADFVRKRRFRVDPYILCYLFPSA